MPPILHSTGKPQSWFTYMVRCADGSLYTGITTDLARRVEEHNSSPLGARYTRTRRPVELLYSESFSNRAKAASREAFLKKLPAGSKNQLARNLHITRKPVKYARITVRADKKITVSIPHAFTSEHLEQLLANKEPWIAKALDRMETKADIGSAPLAADQIPYLGKIYTFQLDHRLKEHVRVNQVRGTIVAGFNLLVPDQMETWRRNEARRLFTAKLQDYATRYNFTYKRLFIRSQRTKWGTCSSKGNISLNYRLITAPEFVIDYMVAHELCHTRHMDHGPQFKTLLTAICPDWKNAEAWLDGRMSL